MAGFGGVERAAGADRVELCEAARDPEGRTETDFLVGSSVCRRFGSGLVMVLDGVTGLGVLVVHVFTAWVESLLGRVISILGGGGIAC